MIAHRQSQNSRSAGLWNSAIHLPLHPGADCSWWGDGHLQSTGWDRRRAIDDVNGAVIDPPAIGYQHAADGDLHESVVADDAGESQRPAIGQDRATGIRTHVRIR